MRLSVLNYDDFKIVVNSFEGDLQKVFYSKAGSGAVAFATALFHSAISMFKEHWFRVAWLRVRFGRFPGCNSTDQHDWFHG